MNSHIESIEYYEICAIKTFKYLLDAKQILKCCKHLQAYGLEYYNFIH